ncbi:hypothetical protein Nepgr_009596 [Nepenthes gracilis]|uniref:SHSP domain-containing protein n=1 Tax=Nepenthes gracilis TaxID=150966 RepID=A0AAD3XKJ4_NEPGR|nr:hypothetical protein Nepgr_009596 [Nepenthes gracilis]
MDKPSVIKSSRKHVLNVTPLNSMPYVDPLASSFNSNSAPSQGNAWTEKNAQPALVYYPSEPTEEEWNDVLSVTMGGVRLTGSAAMGAVGPVLGRMDIGESEDSYMFRVSLPGVAREDFACDVAPNGQILIKGVTTTGEKIVYKNSLKFEMQTQNLCPPGHFSISFKLPGQVDSQQLWAHFGIDGIFEGIVKKKRPTS